MLLKCYLDIGLFHYLTIHPPRDDNNVSRGSVWKHDVFRGALGIWAPEYVPVGGHLNACPRGFEGITEACLGGVEQNRSLSRGYLQVCPITEACPGVHGVLYCPGGGGEKFVIN